MENNDLEYLRRIYIDSEKHGVPSIEEDEGYILYIITYLYALEHSSVVVVDAGAGIGYSTLWLLYGLEHAGCRDCIVVGVEKNIERCRILRENLGKPGFRYTRYSVYCGDAIDYLEKQSSPIDILFIDIEKHRYPEILLKSLKHVKNLIIYHNAIWPPPPEELYRLLHKHRLRYTVLPTENGLLIIHL